MSRHKAHDALRYCRQCGDGLVYRAGLCADCYDAPQPRDDERLWAYRDAFDREPDYGGAIGADGYVYSDADSGL